MCKHGKRGKPSVEWYKNGKPQYYCYGFMDSQTEEMLQVCRECKHCVIHAQEDIDNYSKSDLY